MSIPTLALPRLIRKLEDALGEELCLALNDPSVVEIMLNPDGNLFVERLGRGIAHTGQMDKRAAEVAIGCVAHVLNTEVGDRKPIVSGELPLGGHRFEPMASTTFEGQALVSISAGSVELARAYATSATGASPASPISVRRN